MTYCAAISVRAGLVFISDSRTNAGIDNVSTYSKMHKFGIDGERQFVLLSAGNLATTQGVISTIKKDIHQFSPINLSTISNLSDAADYIGEISKFQQEKHTTAGGNSFEASFIIGGQIAGSKPQAHLIYPEGNHITTSKDTPYLQIGEAKYGKPVLDRILTRDSTLETCTLCALVSMDSTLRSNLTVGPPIEVMVYQSDELVLNRHYRLDEDSEYLRALKKRWDDNLKHAFNNLPPISWSTNWDHPSEDQQSSSG